MQWLARARLRVANRASSLIGPRRYRGPGSAIRKSRGLPRAGGCARGPARYHSNVRLKKPVRQRLATAASGDICNVPCFKEDLVARVKRELPSDTALEEARVLFAALADRTRLRILHALVVADELCVCDVAHVLGMSVAAASHHLRKLRQLGILTLRNDGKMAYYSMRDRFAADLARKAVRQAAA